MLHDQKINIKFLFKKNSTLKNVFGCVEIQNYKLSTGFLHGQANQQ